MGCILTMIDSMVAFIRRNPLTVLLIAILAVGAPWLLKGVISFIVYFILGIIVLGIILSLLFRWRVEKMRREMERQFTQGAGGRQGATGGFGRRTSSRTPTEGEVHIHITDDAPEKRVAEDVGDYVDFEETRR